MEDKKNFTFYHGGVDKDFNIDKIDIYRLSTKQQKNGRDYAGFYMFGEENKNKAFHYAEQTDINSGVAKIEMDDNLNIYELDGVGRIDRIKVDELKACAERGYDLIKGKSFDGMQYILLNKNKIIAMEFQKSLKNEKEALVKLKESLLEISEENKKGISR